MKRSKTNDFISVMFSISLVLTFVSGICLIWKPTETGLKSFLTIVTILIFWFISAKIFIKKKES